MAETLARSEQREQLRESSFPRVEDKWQIAEEVIARRRSLAEAIEQFRDLDRQWPDVRAGTKKPELPWMSEDEWDGRAVIHRVGQVLADRPDEAGAVAGWRRNFENSWPTGRGVVPRRPRVVVR
jgi:hypothetical protein